MNSTAVIWFNRALALASLALAIVSIVMNDADKAPVYVLLSYVLLRSR
jgi:hypothetical protein